MEMLEKRNGGNCVVEIGGLYSSNIVLNGETVEFLQGKSYKQVELSKCSLFHRHLRMLTFRTTYQLFILIRLQQHYSRCKAPTTALLSL